MTLLPIPEHVPEWTQTNTLERQIKEARQRIGKRRWDELDAEWK